MPNTQMNQTPARPRRAVYSVTQTAALCGLSRSRFYDLIREGVMPYPVFCIRSRKPMFTAEMAAICKRVRDTHVGIDGRFLVFYDRCGSESGAAAPRNAQTARCRQSLSSSPRAERDPLAQEMAETLVAMGVRAGMPEIDAAIAAQCPRGVSDNTFETDVRAVFDLLRRGNHVQ